MIMHLLLALATAVLAPPLPAMASPCRPLPPSMDVYFTLGTSEVASGGWVEATINRMEGAPADATVTITGHSAPLHDADREFLLSRQRARLVAEGLIDVGFRDETLIVQWRGAADARDYMPDRVRLDYSFRPRANCPLPVVTGASPR